MAICDDATASGASALFAAGVLTSCDRGQADVSRIPLQVPEPSPLRKAGYLTRADLIDDVAAAIGGSKRQADAVVESIFAAMADSLHRGEMVVVHGFGSFRIRQRRGRTGRNPRTGELVAVPPKSIVYFRTSAKLLNSINPGDEPAPDDED